MNRTRAHIRHADWFRHALEETLLAHFSESGKLGPEWWEEVLDSEAEAKAMYQKYLVDRQTSRNSQRPMGT